MTTTQYATYLLVPFQNKSLVLLATVNGVFLAFLEQHVGISFGILSIYFLLTVLDTIMGVYKNVCVKHNDFKSELFFKKILSVAIMVISITAITQLTVYIGKLPIPFTAIDIFQNTIVYIFNLIKIFLVVAFLSYELTSIRENSLELKWNTVTGAIDIFLLPLTWVKTLLQKKITNNELNPKS
jgi:hypothetical protein